MEILLFGPKMSSYTFWYPNVSPGQGQPTRNELNRRRVGPEILTVDGQGKNLDGRFLMVRIFFLREQVVAVIHNVIATAKELTY